VDLKTVAEVAEVGQFENLDGYREELPEEWEISPNVWIA
jgi:hypothetical protein